MNSRCLFWLNYDDFMDSCVHICMVLYIERGRKEIIVPFYDRRFRQTNFLSFLHKPRIFLEIFHE
jgi:hypothetical protein